MSSLKLRQRQRAALLAGAIAVAGGGAIAYACACKVSERKLRLRSGHSPQRKLENNDDNGAGGRELVQYTGAKESRKNDRIRRGGVKSVLSLATLLAARMGDRGLRSILALAGMAVVRTAVSNRLARVQGLLFSAAFLKRVPLFARLIVENLLLCLAQSAILSTSSFVRGALGLQGRRILTEHIHNDYFQNMVYYKLSHVDDRVTNPEQRIASDVPRFCTELAELLQENIVALCDALFYTQRLCSYTDVKYALGVLAYVLGAGAITGALSPPFGKLMAVEQQREGDYRDLHSRLRTQSESVAFYRGHEREAHLLSHSFSSLVRHASGVLRTQWWFGIVQDFFLKYCGATWAVVLIIGPFFSGSLRPDGTTAGRAAMLSNMRYHTSVVISLFQAMGTLASSTRRLSRLSGYADRIRQLMRVAKELRVASSPLAQNFAEAGHIKFEGVTIKTPVGTTLVEDLNLRIDKGCNLLITGPNGSGKSSLFRVLGGLWPLMAGRIRKPGLASALSREIFYVPQKPYTAVGTLLDQLIYPLTSADLAEPLTEARMREMLRAVDLESILERYPADEEVKWDQELSLGEQQRLGMARLFYHAPAFAILDECTSAVTTDMEERFCSRVRAMGTTCVTISHRPALVAFHDVVLALDGEGGWSTHRRRESVHRSLGSMVQLSPEVSAVSRSAERGQDAAANRNLFISKVDAMDETSDTESYAGAVISSSPPQLFNETLPAIPRPQPKARRLPVRFAALMKILVPRLKERQGGQLAALAVLVLARTAVSDRIASLNGASVRNVVQQDRRAFMHLIAVSVLQSSASAVIAPTLRHLTAVLALGWRVRLTKHLQGLYFRSNAYYKAMHLVEGMDADQRMVQDVDKLCKDLAGLITNMVKPLVDILWFTYRMQRLTGRRGVTILYTYMLLGLGFLRAITPDFGALTAKEQSLEGAFRYTHSRLRTNAESVAFFGGGSREQAVVQGRFRDVLAHAHVLLRKRWLFGIADEFISKQLPHNVTWCLSLLYALDHPEGSSAGVQGQLAQDLRFLASVVSQSFLAFGDLLELYRKFLELSGGISRVSELDEFLVASQQEAKLDKTVQKQLEQGSEQAGDEIAFSNVDVVTPLRKLLARKLTLRLRLGQSLLVTGPNGSGKSSLFRVLGGLWPLATGSLTRPGHGSISSTSKMPDGDNTPGLSSEIFYVPQRPYMALGTLRDQIIYPLSRCDAALQIQREGSGEAQAQDDAASGPSEEALAELDRALRQILQDVRLLYLLDRQVDGWDTSAKWEDVLSLGEQQRLGMARLFFHKPKFGILDECTNATSVDVEEGLYQHAQRRDISVVTISQRPALIPYHQFELRLIDGEGAWELRSIKVQAAE